MSIIHLFVDDTRRLTLKITDAIHDAAANQ